MKILIVEDFRLIAIMLQRALISLGYPDVQITKSAEEATTYLRADHFDLMIIDWMLPGISGVNLIKHLRGWDEYSDTPMLMVTGNNSYEHVMEALKAGATDYMVKPVTPKTLEEKLRKYIPESALATEPSPDPDDKEPAAQEEDPASSPSPAEAPPPATP